MKTDRQFIETYLKPYLTCEKALELGVFNGSELGLYSHHIKKFARELTSIDISNQALQLAEKYFKKKKIDGINLIQMNAAELKFRGGDLMLWLQQVFMKWILLFKLKFYQKQIGF